jgi:hypothetical protein
MQETSEQKQIPVNTEQLGFRGFVSEMVQGIGKMLGLGLLWSLEGARNVFFRMLDRLSIKSRPKRASAFPPGSPRRRKAA